MFGLTLLTFTHLLFRLLTILVPPVRRLLIIIKIRGFTSSDMSTCKNVLSHCYLGDWFVLYQLSKNSNSYFFRYLLRLMDCSFAAQVRSDLCNEKLKCLIVRPSPSTSLSPEEAFPSSARKEGEGNRQELVEQAWLRERRITVSSVLQSSVRSELRVYIRIYREYFGH